jgi:hypothetical protein
MVEGMAQGMKVYSSIIDEEATSLGETAIDSMKIAISKMPDAIAEEVSIRPVITPILDLTDVKQGANQMNNLFGTRPLIEAGSVQANHASAGFRPGANQPVPQGVETGLTRPQISFVQNNMSPKALSPPEIYRQTNNQLSRMKEVLPV